MGGKAGWEPATEAEVALYDALTASDQERYFRALARIELLLPVSADAVAGRMPMGWATWTANDHTHLLAFTSSESMRTCLAEHVGGARRMSMRDLAGVWPNNDWWLAINPGLPIEGYLPAWFVAQLARGDARLPRQANTAPRDRLERVQALERAKAARAAQPPREPIRAPAVVTALEQPALPHGDVASGVALARGDAASGVALARGDEASRADLARGDEASGFALARGGEMSRADLARGGEATRIELARADVIRQEAARAEQERFEAMRAEQARLDAEREEQEREEQQRRARVDAERQEQERRARVDTEGREPQARLDAERAEQERSANGRPRHAEPEPDFVPANAVEEQLYEAAEAGNTDAFLSTLLLATVLIPKSSGTTNGKWRPQPIDGEPHIVCYTSTHHLAEPLETVSVRFIKLISDWPDPNWSFAVNPGTPVGATLPGGQLLALANWAAEVGLGRDEDEVDQPSAEVQGATIAGRVNPEVTVMQKAIAPSQVGFYLDRGYDRVTGFVHRAHELTNIKTPSQMREALGLTLEVSDDIYILRWSAYRPSLYRIPYGGQTEDAMRAMQGWVIERAPFRGNGFAPGESQEIVAEFKVDSARLPHGTRLLRLTAQGEEQLVAVLDSDGQRWLRTDGGGDA